MKAFFFFWMKPNKFWWLLHEFFLWRRTVFFLSSFLGHKFCIRVHSKEIIKIKTAKLLADKYTITTTNHERIHQWIWFLKLMTAHLRKHTTKEWMAGGKKSLTNVIHSKISQIKIYLLPFCISYKIPPLLPCIYLKITRIRFHITRKITD